MLTDIEIAQSAKLKPITKIAKAAGFSQDELEPHGKYKGKICLSAYRRRIHKKDGKLILVTTMTPTRSGEGKTTLTIGLGQALKKIGKKSFIAVREPSLGPVMGMKGGAAGGGYSQVLPMDEINLHFVGDMHEITAAHDLLAAIVDNHIYQGNALGIDPKRVVWHRVMDMNDRALRNITLHSKKGDRKDRFDITASSEVMAIMCLSESIEDMKKRFARIIVGYTHAGKAITAGDLHVQGAMALLMKNALKPNLVQTIEGVPTFVHGGPFANIAHGCSSLMATKLALKVADYVVTEAGFGSDLGAEKFFDIKCRVGNLNPSAVVLVVTVRALKLQGGAGKEDLINQDDAALKKGFENLNQHFHNIQAFGVPCILALNKMPCDTPEEIELVLNTCQGLGYDIALAEVWEKGGAGGKDLAKKVVNAAKQKSTLKFLYNPKDGIEINLGKIAKNIYGASGVEYESEAIKDIKHIAALGLDKLPICVAKTQYSLSHDPKLLGRPKNYKLKVRELQADAGAGFIVAYTGDILTMPGLPKCPAAANMDITEDGKITGLF
ncbi:MAG: formate--tetrahydrofolate ligase [Candidatus Margulisbacteria bacterium]|nr:formate--tetrahydrofolate ligase [Candidatus Margulisiibacteriota bacterium]MBU1021125.1 formate--tetrahydrofolate ligase [Candidatus Margulisiibacteriota bacterium]MBU1728680.1 formate--tetrahydrofolate ligase [Candidatus Margulisiibacteriota bacterium]MBU1955131.1 formate--tetrahydrofolate ligase [Candidatus Margulisiibacteriota bacterium]